MKNRLRILRAERNWSQADLAERLEVSRQSVNAIETGKFDPSSLSHSNSLASSTVPSKPSSRMKSSRSQTVFRVPSPAS